MTPRVAMVFILTLGAVLLAYSPALQDWTRELHRDCITAIDSVFVKPPIGKRDR